MGKYFILALFLAILPAACGGQAIPPEPTATLQIEATVIEAGPVDLGPVTAVAQLNGDSQSLETPTGLALDGDGNLYVIDTLNHRIVIFDHNGNAVASWGTKGTEPGQFNFQYKEDLNSDESDEVAADIFVTSDGLVYVADNGNERVQVFDSEGNFVREFATTGEDGAQSQPFSLAVDTEGSVYTIDLQFFVTKYDSAGNVVSRWGGRGIGNEKFSEIGFMDIDAEGFIYVADAYQHFIHKFGSNGEPIAMIPVPRLENSEAAYSTPTGLDVTEDGLLYVTDYLSDRIVVLDAEGNVLVEWAGFGHGLGEMDGPVDVVVDPNGNIYVSETFNDRVQVFRLNQ